MGTHKIEIYKEDEVDSDIRELFLKEMKTAGEDIKDYSFCQLLSYDGSDYMLTYEKLECDEDVSACMEFIKDDGKWVLAGSGFSVEAD